MGVGAGAVVHPQVDLQEEWVRTFYIRMEGGMSRRGRVGKLLEFLELNVVLGI